MSNYVDLSNGPIKSLQNKVLALEQRLDLALAAAQTSAAALQKTQQQIVTLEHTVANQQCAALLAQISKIYPKNRCVIFIGTGYFGDNIKYAYLAFTAYARQHGIACFFATEDVRQYELLIAAGLPCLRPIQMGQSKEEFQTLLGTKIVVLSDLFVPSDGVLTAQHALLQGAQQIQLWHGIPLKEIGFQNLSAGEIMAACGPFETLVATNLSSRNDWARRFAFREFSALGYPRNDVLLREPSAHDLLNVDSACLAGMQAARQQKKPVIFYAPTFRDHGDIGWLDKAELQKFSRHCRDKGYSLFVNLHPCEQKFVADLRPRYPDLTFVEPSTDAYPLLRMADLLISDYSSLVFDYLLLDRPVVFYRPDHADYIAHSRALIPGRDHYSSVGPVCSDIDALIAAVDKTVPATEADPYREARHSLRSELFDHTDGKAADRLCELIARHLDAMP